MKKDNKKALYESIMVSVAKEVKKVLNEAELENEYEAELENEYYVLFFTKERSGIFGPMTYDDTQIDKEYIIKDFLEDYGYEPHVYIRKKDGAINLLNKYGYGSISGGFRPDRKHYLDDINYKSY